MAPREGPRDVPFAGLITLGEALPAERSEEVLAEHWAEHIEADHGR